MCRCSALLWCPPKPSKEKDSVDSFSKTSSPKIDWLTMVWLFGSSWLDLLFCASVAQILCVQVRCPSKPSNKKSTAGASSFSWKLVQVLCCFLRNACVGTVPPPKQSKMKGELWAISLKSQTLPKPVGCQGFLAVLCSVFLCHKLCVHRHSTVCTGTVPCEAMMMPAALWFSQKCVCGCCAPFLV
jgi:hypothetical protein